MKAVNVASFNELSEAEVVKNRLEQAGIHAEVYDESKLQRFWFLSEPFAGKHVRVDERDFDKAKEALDALDAKENVLHHAVRCPECGSPRVEYPAATRKFVGPTLVEIFATTVHVMDKEFYCENCHHTWSNKITLARKTDVLGWPVKKETKPSQV
jgi:hypothetical protein